MRLMAALALVMVLASASGADGTLHLVTGGQCTSGGGVDFALGPGYYLTEPDWTRVDAELRRLQDEETRLTAENDSLRKSAAETPAGWGTMVAVASAFAAGIALGVGAFR